MEATTDSGVYYWKSEDIDKKEYIMAFDIGTTGCRTILFDRKGNIAGSSYKEFPQIYPKPGWVEHDAEVIWKTQMEMTAKVLVEMGISAAEVAGIGITNQRETTVVWNRHTGKPVMNAIVWQDKRTSDISDGLVKMGLTDYISENTGLRPDSYFSGTKIKWILDNVEGARESANNGDLLFGTIDCWMIWKLTGGKSHVTDYSNASRTLLFNIRKLCWDDTMLKALDIPRSVLPEVRPSSDIYGYTDTDVFFGAAIPVAGAIGDQQAALFGQACFEPGMVKATYGTGGSLMINAGDNAVVSKNGLLTSIAWGLDGKVEYSLEGLLYIVGASIQWLRDELRIIDSAAETEAMALSVPDTNGVYLVPAFVGLSAPYWDQYARGALIGLTRGANRDHIARAALESIAYQIKDVLVCMEQDTGIKPVELKVDGGATKNNFLMQFQSTLLGIEVKRPKVVDTTARGAAFLAGLATGFWRSKEELLDTFELDRSFEPEDKDTQKLYEGWLDAVRRTMTK